jgi:hypothetical protein
MLGESDPERAMAVLHFLGRSQVYGVAERAGELRYRHVGILARRPINREGFKDIMRSWDSNDGGPMSSDYVE